MKRTIRFTLLAIWLQGCAHVGFDFTPPHNASPYSKPPSPEARKELAAWWRRFHDPTLNTLIAHALRHNYDIKAAALRIMQSRAALGIAQGYRYPQIQQLSGNAAAAYRSDRDIQSASLAFDTAWEADIWGMYARGVESADAAYIASIASYHDIFSSVVAETARQYVLYRTAQKRLLFAYRNAAIQARIVHMTQIRFASGNVSELDMQQARVQLYSTRSAVFAIRQDMLHARNALAVLLGVDPTQMKRLLHNPRIARTLEKHRRLAFSSNPSLPALAASVNQTFVPAIKLNTRRYLDAALLTRRPDLKAAEALAHAAAAEVGIAQAELYPHVSLFGTLAFSPNNTFGSWINGKEALQVSFGPSFRWNIFHYGRIKNTVRLKDARFEEMLARYNQTVRKALSEVSDAAEGYRLTQLQLEQTRRMLKATDRAFQLSLTQYDNGLVSYQRLLTAVEQLTRAQDLYAQLQGLRAQQAVYFFKAVGGGWQTSLKRPLLDKAAQDRMRARTDWGDLLNTGIPSPKKEHTRE